MNVGTPSTDAASWPELVIYTNAYETTTFRNTRREDLQIIMDDAFANMEFDLVLGRGVGQMLSFMMNAMNWTAKGVRKQLI